MVLLLKLQPINLKMYVNGLLRTNLGMILKNRTVLSHKGKQDENCVAQRLFEEETSE